MPNYEDMFFSALHSKIDSLKFEAKHLRNSSKIKHHEALNYVALSFGCRDWQHLCYVTEEAREACLSRSCGVGFSELEFEPSMLTKTSLKDLCKEHPDVALIAVEAITIDLFEELFDTIRTPSLFAKRATNFGDGIVNWNDKNTPGWRLNIDVESGFLFYGQYPASGKMVALIDGSVPYDAISDTLDVAPEADEEDIIDEVRESHRGLGDIVFYGREEKRQEVTLSLVEACHEAVVALIRDQCGVDLTSDYS